MFGATFYFGSTRKYITLFGTLFNDIVIKRTDNDGKEQIIKVPIVYSPKEKMQKRLMDDPDINRPFSILLPTMSFEEKVWSYDGTRHLPSINRVVKKDDADSGKLYYQYNPVPWNIPFTLSIYAKNLEDGNKIVEQIIPFFSPVWTATIDIIPEMDISIDVPITISSSLSPPSPVFGPGDLKTPLMLVWTLNFIMRAWFFGPVKHTAIIKIANTTFYIANTVDIHDSIGHVDPAERLIIRPGLDAQGKPVNYDGTLPGPNNTLPITQIYANSDFGYIQTYESVGHLGESPPIPHGGANVAITITQTEEDNETWEEREAEKNAG